MEDVRKRIDAKKADNKKKSEQLEQKLFKLTELRNTTKDEFQGCTEVSTHLNQLTVTWNEQIKLYASAGDRYEEIYKETEDEVNKTIQKAINSIDKGGIIERYTPWPQELRDQTREWPAKADRSLENELVVVNHTCAGVKKFTFKTRDGKTSDEVCRMNHHANQAQEIHLPSFDRVAKIRVFMKNENYD